MSPVLMILMFMAAAFIATVVYHINRKKPVKEEPIDEGPSELDKIYSHYGPVIDFVRSEYDRKDRFYHNWDHIQEGLEFLAKNLNEMHRGADDATTRMNKSRLILAWLFHDAVYDLEEDDNEVHSGKFAIHSLQLEFDQYVHEGIDRMIEATITHEKTESFTTNQLIDVDLLRLADDYETFLKHTDGVFKEYQCCNPDLTIDVFTLGRIVFLKGLLQRESLFTTKFFQERYEEHAQRNITRYIEENEIT